MRLGERACQPDLAQLWDTEASTAAGRLMLQPGVERPCKPTRNRSVCEQAKPYQTYAALFKAPVRRI